MVSLLRKVHLHVYGYGCYNFLVWKNFFPLLGTRKVLRSWSWRWKIGFINNVNYDKIKIFILYLSRTEHYQIVFCTLSIVVTCFYIKACALNITSNINSVKRAYYDVCFFQQVIIKFKSELYQTFNFKKELFSLQVWEQEAGWFFILNLRTIQKEKDLKQFMLVSKILKTSNIKAFQVLTSAAWVGLKTNSNKKYICAFSIFAKDSKSEGVMATASLIY